MEHFIYPVFFDDQVRNVLWFSNEVDGLVTDQDGQIATFACVDDARAFTQNRALQVSAGNIIATRLTLGRAGFAYLRQS